MWNPSDPRYKSLVSVLGVLAFILFLANFSVFASNWFSRHAHCGMNRGHRATHEFVEMPAIAPIPPLPPPPPQVKVDLSELDRELARAEREIRQAELKMRRSAQEHARTQAIHRIEIKRRMQDGQEAVSEITIDQARIQQDVKRELERIQAEVKREVARAQQEARDARKAGQEIHVTVK